MARASRHHIPSLAAVAAAPVIPRFRRYSVAVGGLPAASVLVGRDAELAVLDSLAAQAAAGTGGAVLLCGEPGIGKTRLAREISGRARGAVVSWGACRECEGAPPSGPGISPAPRTPPDAAAAHI